VASTRQSQHLPSQSARSAQIGKPRPNWTPCRTWTSRSCVRIHPGQRRIERFHQTLQTASVKKMRLHHFSTLEQATLSCPILSTFQSRFAVVPRSSNDAHRPLSISRPPPHFSPGRNPRLLSKTMTLRSESHLPIPDRSPRLALRKAARHRCEMPPPNITILYKSKPLPYSIFSSSSISTIVGFQTVEPSPLLNQSKATSLP